MIPPSFSHVLEPLGRPTKQTGSAPNSVAWSGPCGRRGIDTCALSQRPTVTATTTTTTILLLLLLFCFCSRAGAVKERSAVQQS